MASVLTDALASQPRPLHTAMQGTARSANATVNGNLDVNGVLHLGLTALHMAVMGQRVEVAHGADLNRRDQIHHGTALGWAEHNFRDSATHRFLEQIASGGV